MAATFSPIVQTLIEPAISVTSTTDLNYETLNASIGGGYAFGVKNIYQFSTNINQLIQPLQLKKYNKFGDIHIYYLHFTVDPFQFSAALSTPMKELNYDLDGNNAFEPFLLPNVSLDFRIDITEMNPSNYLTKGENNFGDLEFFADYMVEF